MKKKLPRGLFSLYKKTKQLLTKGDIVSTRETMQFVKKENNAKYISMANKRIPLGDLLPTKRLILIIGFLAMISILFIP